MGIRNLIFLWVLTVLAASFPTTVSATYTVHCKEDVNEIVSLLETASASGDELGTRMVAVAKALQGKPFKDKFARDSTGMLIIDLQEMGKLEFINNVMAIARASFATNPGFETYAAEMENVTYRSGKENGFPSILFYGADWIGDNLYRGHLREMTEYMTGGGFRTKTLDRLSNRSEDYAALKDSINLERIKNIEMGFRSHRIPHLKKQSAGNKPIHELMKDGDIIMMLDPASDYDIYDIGIVEMKEGVPYLIHMKPGANTIGEDEYPLSRLFKLEGQHFYGYRWLRPEI